MKPPMCILPRVLKTLAIFLCITALWGCDRTPRPHPADRVRYPVSIVADPAGDYLYLVGSNFDLAFDGGAVSVLDAKTHKLVPGSAAETFSIGGKLAVLSDGTQGKALYLTSREHNALQWISITRENGVPKLRCNDAGGKRCDGNHSFGGLNSDNSLGLDPFGVGIHPATDTAPGLLYTTAFDGQISVFQTDKDGKPDFDSFTRSGSASGAYDLAIHPVTGAAYSTSKFTNGIFATQLDTSPPPADPKADPATLPKIPLLTRLALAIDNPMAGNDHSRGVAFNADGSLAFISYRRPNSLLIMDTSVDGAGAPANKLVSIIPLGDSPAAVAVATSSTDGRELVYVTLFDADAIAVIDPSRSEVIARIEVGNGPFDIAIIDNDQRKRAYVTLFHEHSVGVIELDPTDPYYHQEIARIR